MRDKCVIVPVSMQFKLPITKDVADALGAIEAVVKSTGIRDFSVHQIPSDTSLKFVVVSQSVAPPDSVVSTIVTAFRGAPDDVQEHLEGAGIDVDEVPYVVTSVAPPPEAAAEAQTDQAVAPADVAVAVPASAPAPAPARAAAPARPAEPAPADCCIIA